MDDPFRIMHVRRRDIDRKRDAVFVDGNVDLHAADLLSAVGSTKWDSEEGHPFGRRGATSLVRHATSSAGECQAGYTDELDKIPRPAADQSTIGGASVTVDAASRLAAKIAGVNHLPQERARTVFGIGEVSVKDIHG